MRFSYLICFVLILGIQDVWAQEILTLPVVVHILHGGESVGTGSNLSATQVASQWEVLNEDFRRKPGTPGFNEDSTGADTHIEFVPALLGPDGFPLEEPGIHRVDREEAGFATPPYGGAYLDSVIKPQTIWDPTRYLNIWTTDLNMVRGLAQFPDSSGLSLLPDSAAAALTDGIVVQYNDFGRTGNLLRTHHFGRTATHEIGHFLGLLHVWGDGTCESDDGCEDTPPADRPSTGCLPSPTNCGQTTVSNYMDFSSGFCRNVFTQCQALRMQQVLMKSPRRRELLSSPVMNIPELQPVADFSFELSATGCDGRVRFRDRSVNQPFSWQWDFGNGTTSTHPEPTVVFDREGTFTVTLTVSNFKGSSQHSQEISVCLTGQAPTLRRDGIGLATPFPQPVRTQATFSAQLASPGRLTLSLKDLRGLTVGQLFSGPVQPGPFEWTWARPAALSPGLYYLCWQWQGRTFAQKLVLR